LLIWVDKTGDSSSAGCGDVGKDLQRKITRVLELEGFGAAVI